ncbi:hypothetical protein [Pseudoalteromonas peptidolytica]|uniref:hypothetical protein n=1 Tax=Pseudoalteromonas peptidolytica TaxID=61150 RepID=UPI00298E4C39|nr:hypothetical protein [Pseudoalteromonas peptidolytica]MDW7549710.1 hypothetical protein [Pseudoalteromonas peptidolytica]
MSDVQQRSLLYVASQSVSNCLLFYNLQDCHYFTQQLKSMLHHYQWDIVCFNLTSKNYHLLLFAHQSHLSSALQQLHVIYSKYLNRQHCHDGQVFKTHYQVKRITETGLAPVSIRILQEGLQCQSKLCWSILDEALGSGVSIKQSCANNLLPHISKRPQIAFEKLLLLSILPAQDSLRHVLKFYTQDGCDKELTTKDDMPLWLIFAQQEKKQEAIYHAYYHHHFTLAEIASFLGVHKSTVSRQLRACNL